MTTGRIAARPLVATRLVIVAASVALIASGCGQVTIGEQSPDTASSTSNTTSRTTASTPPPTPGPQATPGCDELTGPVHQLVHTENPDESLITEVRELADGVDDNALSAVASRLSGFVAQPDFDQVAVETQWDQFQQLCDLD